jgi:glycine cleavage system regulatory protein
MVSVRAPDRPGLLWAIAAWFEEHDCNIEVARIDGQDDTATDTFVVIGPVDAEGLANRLSGRGANALPRPVILGLSAASRAADAANAVRRRLTRSP